MHKLFIALTLGAMSLTNLAHASKVLPSTYETLDTSSQYASCYGHILKSALGFAVLANKPGKEGENAKKNGITVTGISSIYYFALPDATREKLIEDGINRNDSLSLKISQAEADYCLEEGMRAVPSMTGEALIRLNKTAETLFSAFQAKSLEKARKKQK